MAARQARQHPPGKGVRDPDSGWDFDGVFTVQTEDGELVRVHGWNCTTEVL